MYPVLGLVIMKTELPLSLGPNKLTLLYRLVVIADKNKVHSEFPIPLINRLEKHYVSATSLLSKEQKGIKRELEDWTMLFVKPQRLQ